MTGGTNLSGRRWGVVRSWARGGCVAFLFLFALALGLTWLFPGAVLPFFGRFLVASDPPARADAIVVLAGSVPDRILEAVKLYHEGFARRILLSRPSEMEAVERLRDLGIQVPLANEINRAVAEQMGVPRDAIEDIHITSNSTYGEAREIVQWLRARGYRVILLVTSRYHARRAGMVFRDVADGNLRILVRPSRFDDYDPEAWWRRRITLRRTVVEYQKLLFYWLVDRWNVNPVLVVRSPWP